MTQKYSLETSFHFKWVLSKEVSSTIFKVFDWTHVFWTIGEHSTHWAIEPLFGK